MPDHCIVDGCGCVHKARWLCGRHYDVLRASPVEVRMDWPTLRDGEPTDWDIERLLASESATLAQDSATDSATDSARVAELEAELGEVRPAVSLLRGANADLRAECERLRGDLLQVAQHRDRLECERHDAVHELAEVETLLRAIYADVVSVEQCERLQGARVVALGLRRVLTSRSEASCKRDGMMHVPRVHLETVASLLGKAADELEPWRTDRDGVVGLMVRATVDHLEFLLEAE
jgi:regulator of replication initiation timing